MVYTFVRTLRKLSKDMVGFTLPTELSKVIEVGKGYTITIDEIGAEIKPEVKNP